MAIPESDLFAELEQQQHRRFIKTHTPLDGLPLHDDVHYVVVARDPLDMAVSPGEMARLVDELGFAVDPNQVEALADEATFEAMKGRSHELIPDHRGVIKDPDQFFRQGRSGAGLTALPNTLLNEYSERTSKLAPAELLEWLHRR